MSIFNFNGKSARKKKRKKKITKDPTKFSKKIVVFCISFITFYTVLQVLLSYKLNIELSPTLTTCVYAFFGTELTASAAIRVFDKGTPTQNSTDNKSSVG